MATFLVAHGAWSAGFVWKKMHPLMRAAGHELITPSYTGLGERLHLATPEINLETHIQDMLGVLFHEDLHDVILIGHSYGGMVATGIADRAPERISRIVYLDAFVPKDGQSAFDLVSTQVRARMEELTAAEGDGWRLPSNPLPPDTARADVDWITPRRHMQPIKTFSQPLRLANGETDLPRTYIYCKLLGPVDMFGPFAQEARSAGNWTYLEIEASHSPHVTAPRELADMLVRIAGDTT